MPDDLVRELAGALAAEATLNPTPEGYRSALYAIKEADRRRLDAQREQVKVAEQMLLTALSS